MSVVTYRMSVSAHVKYAQLYIFGYISMINEIFCNPVKQFKVDTIKKMIYCLHPFTLNLISGGIAPDVKAFTLVE